MQFALIGATSVFSGRLPREFPENAIELRQRLESGRERDFAHTKIPIVQKTKRLFESCAGNVLDEVNPGHLLELLAQVIPADVDRLGHLNQRKLFIRMLMDKIPRFPDVGRLRSVPLWGTNSLQLMRAGCLHLHATTSRDRAFDALRLLLIACLILLTYAAWQSRGGNQ